MSETNEKELDSYGVWIKKAPNEIANDDFNFDADLPDFSDIDVSSFDEKNDEKKENKSEEVPLDDFLNSDFSEKKEEPANEIEPIDIDLSFDSDKEKIASEPSSSSIDDFEQTSDLSHAGESFSDDTEEIDISDFGIDMNDDSHAAEKTSPSTLETTDYDLSVDGATKTNDFPEPVVTNFDEEAKSLMDNVTEPESRADETLLRKIADDLSGLKNEIADLKNEFVELKARSKSMPQTAPSEIQKGGFFSDLDDDETISLSGDELDNIMNTSDFAATSPTVSANEQTDKAPNQADSAASTAEKNAESKNDSLIEAAGLESNADLDFPTPIDETEDNTFHNVETDDNLVIDFDEKIEEEGKDANEDDELASIADIELPKASDILPTEPEQDVAPIESEASADFEEPQARETASGDASFENRTGEQLEEPAFDVNNYFKDDPSGVEAFVKNELAKNNTANEEPAAEKEAKPAFDVNNYFKDDPSEVEAFVKNELAKNNAANEEPAAKEEATEGMLKKAENEEKPSASGNAISDDLKEEIKSVLLYMDKLLENLPETKIVEFAKSEEFSTYKKLFETLGIA